MTSSTPPRFEGCDLTVLGANDIRLLSACWREGKVKMAHRNGKVDLTLICGHRGCACAMALEQRLSG